MAAEEAAVPAAEESAPLPQGETIAPAAEAKLPEASLVKGEYAADARPSSSSSHSPREADPVFHLMIGEEVDGSIIPEAVPVVPEAEVAEEVRDDVLPGSNLEVVVSSQRFRMRSRSVRRRCPRPPRVVMVDLSFWQTILSTRRQ
jgi:hypothetical protein